MTFSCGFGPCVDCCRLYQFTWRIPPFQQEGVRVAARVCPARAAIPGRERVMAELPMVGEDRRDRRLCVQEPAVDRGPVGRGLAAGERDRAAGADRGTAGLAH